MRFVIWDDVLVGRLIAGSMIVGIEVNELNFVYVHDLSGYFYLSLSPKRRGCRALDSLDRVIVYGDNISFINDDNHFIGDWR